MRISDWSSDVCSSDLLDTGDDNRTLNLGLGADITVIPETLTASLYYSLNHRLGDGDTPDSSSVNGEIVWTLRPPEMNTLGISLAFTGFVQETNDDLDNPENDLQYQPFTPLTRKPDVKGKHGAVR